MPTLAAIFDEYALAMQRKREIALWHAEHLREYVGIAADTRELPPIELQAHFEGSGRALASIPDQLASGVCEVLEDLLPTMPKPHNAYLHNAAKGLPDGSPLRRAIEPIVGDPRYCDLRAWRNRATHRFDRKAMLDGLWEVASPEGCEDYVTERELTAYIDIMLGFGEEIVRRTWPVRDLAFELRGSLTA